MLLDLSYEASGCGATGDWGLGRLRSARRYNVFGAPFTTTMQVEERHTDGLRASGVFGNPADDPLRWSTTGGLLARLQKHRPVVELFEPRSAFAPCLSRPAAPPGVSVEANVAAVASARAGMSLVQGPIGATGNASTMVVLLSAPRSLWDFKHWHGPQFEPFGNFHFGAVASAAGIPRAVALRGAGALQFVSPTYDSAWGAPWGGPPHADDPRDQAQISAGYGWSALCR